MTDVELDERVTALEENNGGVNTQNGNKLCYGDLWFLASKGLVFLLYQGIWHLVLRYNCCLIKYKQ